MNDQTTPNYGTNNNPPRNNSIHQLGNNQTDNSEKARWLLVCFAVALPILGVISFLITKEVWIVVALNTPLMVIIRYYFPKHNSR